MHINLLKYNGIKNVTSSKEVTLSPVQLITGPNGAGKSGMLEAIRLASSGRSSLGAKQKTMKICSNEEASAEVFADGFSSGWSLSGKTGDELQGGMPVDIESFSSLSGDKKLALLGSSSVICELTAEIDSTSEKLKAVKKKLNSSPPESPGVYEGESLQSLLSFRDKLKNSLREHDALIAYESSFEAGIGSELEKARESLSEAEKGLDAAVSGTPSLVMYACKNGKTYGDLMRAINEAADYLGIECSMVDGNYSSDAAVELPGLEELRVVYDRKLREMRTLEQKLAAQPKKPECQLDKPLSDDMFETQVNALARVEEHIYKAEAFLGYERQARQYGELMAKLNHEKQVLTERLDMLRSQRTEEIRVLVGGLEEEVNAKLIKVGLDSVRMQVSCNSRSSSLEIVCGDIPVDGLARSYRVMYNVIILSAIQQRSGAVCPVLVCESAELSLRTLDLLVKAVGVPEKGNVVLEHWANPGSDFACDVLEI